MTLVILPMIAISLISLFFIAILKSKHSRKIAIISTFINMVLTLLIFMSSISAGSVNLSENYMYIPSLGISLGFRVNIISLMLLIMSSVVLFAAALSGNPEKEHTKLSSALILIFQVAAMGLFSSSNLIVFFIFWDIGVIAMFFMINALGSANAKTASMNFLIYEIFASSLLLLGILIIYFYTPVHSFDIQTIISSASSIPVATQSLVFFLIFIAFMINMPIFPMHSWLPDAHTEASTQGSMILSGVLTKFGGFGMLMLFSMMPIAYQYSLYIAAFAMISVFYSVFLLIRQTDIKRIIAYSTIVEMSIILLGISTLNGFGTYGAAYAMLSHGLAIALMFLLIGVIKHLFGERNINALKGIVVNASTTTYTFIIGTLAMIGFPLTAGFIADVLLFIGAFQAFGIYGMIPLIALIIMGAYLYYVINKCMLSAKEHSETVDFIAMEQKLGYAVLVFFIFLFGFLPFTLLNLVKL
ncbi:MAG: NADH-quinone oxidoreductase subunit M [Candidatus Micrarchaeaceae archaeon]|jgi:NADH-quinone oxidoreductase subunit M